MSRAFTEDKIVKRGGKWCVISHTTGRSFGCYPGKEEAVKRLGQIKGYSGEGKVEDAAEPHGAEMRFYTDHASAALKVDAIEIKGNVAVIPAVFTKEGVQNDGYKSREELKKSWRWMENRPVTDGHPPGTLNALSDVRGVVRNVQFREADAAIHGDVWVFLDQPGKALLEEVKSGKKQDVSIGFWADTVLEDGQFGGKPYNHRQVNVLHDHLAILEAGACSREDGCGLTVNREAPPASPPTAAPAAVDSGVRSPPESGSGFVKSSAASVSAMALKDSLASIRDAAVKALADEAPVIAPAKPCEDKLTEAVEALQVKNAALEKEVAGFRAEKAAAEKARKDAAIKAVSERTGVEAKALEAVPVETLELLARVGTLDASLRETPGSIVDAPRKLTVGSWDPATQGWKA